MDNVSKTLKIISEIADNKKAIELWISGNCGQEFVVKKDGTFSLINRNEKNDDIIARISCPSLSFSKKLITSYLDKTIILG